MTIPGNARTSRPQLPRIAVIVVLGALLLSACGNPSPTPSPSPSPSPSPASPSPSASAAAEGPCEPADLTATAGPWGGAAGSRGADVVVANAGAEACILPAGPTVAMVDQGGAVVLANTPPQPGSGPSLAPGATIGFSVLIGNWCDEQVALPLRFSLALATDAIDIANLVASTIDDLPPCNGPGQPPTITTTEWLPG